MLSAKLGGLTILNHTYHLALTALAYFLVAGCAPAVLNTNPRGWPQQWQGRHLYTTPNAYIYASNEIAAGEMDRLVIDAGKNFEKYTNRSPKKLLVIVTDINDPPVADAEVLFKASKRNELISQGLSPTDEEIHKLWEEAKNNAERNDYSIDKMAYVMVISTTAKELKEQLVFPQAVWDLTNDGVLLPTRAAGKVALSQAFEGTVRNGALKPEQKLLARLTMPLVMSKMTDVLTKQCRQVLFLRLVDMDGELGEKEKSTLIQTYKDDHPDIQQHPM